LLQEGGEEKKGRNDNVVMKVAENEMKHEGRRM
jgi:hypothetical protein